MSTTIQGTQTGGVMDFTALAELAIAQVKAQGGTTVPGSQESVKALLESVTKSFSTLLPELPAPKAGSSNTGSFVGGLSMGGLSLETLMDAVGMEQRRTETKAGTASLQARAQERAEANEEKLKSIQEQLEKSKSQGVLDGFLKAFKIIGMVIAAIASVAMIAAGAVGMAAGGSGAALIAVGVTAMVLLASSITEEATEGKVGFSPAFITGKIMEAAGASEEAITWTKFAVDLLTSIALVVASCGAGAAGGAAKAAQTGTSAATTAATAATETAQTAATAASKTADTIQKVASMTARVATIAGGVNTIAQSATAIASAENEKDMSFLQAQQKRLQAILEKIAMANDLDIEHLKEMMQRSEQTLQQVSDIVQEGAQTNVAILSGSPAMA